MERLKRGWRLAMVSLGVLRSDRSLGVFPILGGLASLFAIAAFGAPAALFWFEDLPALTVILAAIGIYLAGYLGIFFSVALAGAAAQTLDGKDASVSGGLAVARRSAGTIAGWAAIVVSVNVILRAIADRAGPLGDLVVGIFGLAWGLVTFLVIPVIALEDVGPITGLKRSAGIFRQRWGEQITGNLSIGIFTFVVAFLPAVIILAVAFATGNTIAIGVGIAIAAILFVIGAVLSAALNGIFSVALYRYATGQEETGPFAVADLESAIRPRRARESNI